MNSNCSVRSVGQTSGLPVNRASGPVFRRPDGHGVRDSVNRQTGGSMPLGIGTWSGGYHAQNGWHRGNGVSSVPPHPGPLPREREMPSPAFAYRAHPQARSAASVAPSPLGRGQG